DALTLAVTSSSGQPLFAKEAQRPTIERASTAHHARPSMSDGRNDRQPSAAIPPRHVSANALQCLLSRRPSTAPDMNHDGEVVMTRTRLAAVLAAATALSLGAGGALLPSAHADPPEQHLLLHYDFSQDGQVTDASGNGNHGTIHGTGAQVNGGVLTLPGGANDSGAGYVQFPEGIFEGQNTLTISTWLRNETGSGNYAALFFGSAEGPFPAQYWLLNPANPAGRFKSVLTNSLNPDAPWGTEYGISPTDASHRVSGTVTDGDWAMSTTVITPTTLTGYYNGSRIGEVELDRTVSDFGTGLVGYIGRSTYPDKFYQGAVDDVFVSTAAY